MTGFIEAKTPQDASSAAAPSLMGIPVELRQHITTFISDDSGVITVHVGPLPVYCDQPLRMSTMAALSRTCKKLYQEVDGRSVNAASLFPGTIVGAWTDRTFCCRKYENKRFFISVSSFRPDMYGRRHDLKEDFVFVDSMESVHIKVTLKDPVTDGRTFAKLQKALARLTISTNLRHCSFDASLLYRGAKGRAEASAIGEGVLMWRTRLCEKDQELEYANRVVRDLEGYY